MAIAYDTTAAAATGNAVSSRSLSLAASGSDRLAIIAVCWVSGTYTAPSAVTVGGSAATLIEEIEYYAGASRLSLYRFIAPPTSSTTYEVTWGGNVDDAALGVVTYTGVHQTTPTNGSGENNGSSTTPTITISSATGEIVVAAAAGRYPTTAITEDGGQTERVVAANWGGNQATFSICEEAGAASVTESWTVDSSSEWAAIAVRLNVAAAALTKKLKLLAHSSAASATGVSGIVFTAPTGENIAGAEIGEFSGQAFEASLEGGKAVLKVAVDQFGGEALTTSDHPVALVRTTTHTTGIITTDIIEE